MATEEGVAEVEMEFAEPRSTLPVRPRRQRPVSLCMIVRDEAQNLPQCLASVADVVDEMVVVDTGSRDHTKEIARGFGARVVSFPWTDDFAAARNASVDGASSDWIFWLDADEYLDESNRATLLVLLDELPDVGRHGFLMTQVSSTPGNLGAVLVEQIRLFTKAATVSWTRPVHEQIVGSLRKTGATIHRTGIRINHSGYATPELQTRKRQRNRTILERALTQAPNDPFVLLHLGLESAESGQGHEARSLMTAALKAAAARSTIARRARGFLCEDALRDGRIHDAELQARAALDVFPEDVELLFLLARVRMLNGEYGRADELLRRISERGVVTLGAGFSVERFRRELVHFRASNAFHQGALSEAEATWRLFLARDATFAPAIIGLSCLLLKAGRAADWEEFRRWAKASSPTYITGLMEVQGFVWAGDLAAASASAAAVEGPFRSNLPQGSMATLQAFRDFFEDVLIMRLVLGSGPVGRESTLNPGVLVSRERAERE